MGRNPNISDFAFYRTDKKTALIPGGATTHADPVNLQQNWAFPHIIIANCQGIPTNATLSIQYALANDDPLVTLYTKDTGAVWSKTLASTGSMGWIVTDLAFAQKIKFTLSSAWVNPGSFAGLEIAVYAFEKGYGN